MVRTPTKNEVQQHTQHVDGVKAQYTAFHVRQVPCRHSVNPYGAQHPHAHDELHESKNTLPLYSTVYVSRPCLRKEHVGVASALDYIA